MPTKAKSKTLISVPKTSWDESMRALETLNLLTEWLAGDQEIVPNRIKNLLRKDKKGTIDVTVWCVLCTENHTIHLNINKSNNDNKQVCQHTTFIKSRIK